MVVIPTKTVPQGITAMMNVDFEAADPKDIADRHDRASLSSVTTAQITYAARNSDFDGFEINEGDYLALEEGKLFGTDRDITALLRKLAQEANGKEAAFVVPLLRRGRVRGGRQGRRRAVPGGLP